MQIGDNYLSSLQNNINTQQQTNESILAKLKEYRAQQAKNGEKETIEKEEEERKNYGSQLLKMMDDESYEAFERATKGLDEGQKERYAASLQVFSYSYISSVTGLGEKPSLSLLTQEGGDDEGLLGSSFMLKVSSYHLKEGANILKSMSDTSGESMFSFMSRFQNAMLSGNGIDIKS